jgi:hypothetical protein
MSRTWHHGLMARWWAEFNTGGDDIDVSADMSAPVARPPRTRRDAVDRPSPAEPRGRRHLARLDRGARPAASVPDRGICRRAADGTDLGLHFKNEIELMLRHVGFVDVGTTAFGQDRPPHPWNDDRIAVVARRS